jgi:hypothetical protein
MGVKRNYRVTRRRTIGSKPYPLVFSWGEGDPHIMVQFPGCIPHDTISVFNHATASSTITGREQFIAEVREYARTVDKDTILSAWNLKVKESR